MRTTTLVDQLILECEEQEVLKEFLQWASTVNSINNLVMDSISRQISRQVNTILQTVHLSQVFQCLWVTEEAIQRILRHRASPRDQRILLLPITQVLHLDYLRILIELLQVMLHCHPGRMALILVELFGNFLVFLLPLDSNYLFFPLLLQSIVIFASLLYQFNLQAVLENRLDPSVGFTPYAVVVFSKSFHNCTSFLYFFVPTIVQFNINVISVKLEAKLERRSLAR